MLFDFLPNTLLIYRQPELSVWVCSHYCTVFSLDFILLWVLSPLILRLFSHYTNHSNYACVIHHLVHIKLSSAAFQTLMLNSCSELIVQKKVHSWPEVLNFLQSLFPSCSIEQIWKRWLFISHLWSASLITAALWGVPACSRSRLGSICNRLAERKILEMLPM